jgi:hypothetical protein
MTLLITGDEPASQRQTIFKVMVPLVGNQVACPVCEGKGIHLFFMSLSDLNRHLDQHHTDVFSGVASVGKVFQSYMGPSVTYLNVLALIKEQKVNINAKYVP